MEISELENTLDNLEEALEKFQKEELVRYERMQNEIKSVEKQVKELQKKETLTVLDFNKMFEEKLEHTICNKKKKQVKNIKKEFCSQLKILKNEKKHNCGNFTNKKTILCRINEITNDAKQNFLVLNAQSSFMFQSFYERLTRLKDKSLIWFEKCYSIQKEVHLVFQIIQKSVSKDMLTLNANSVFIQNELINMFEYLCYHIENALK